MSLQPDGEGRTVVEDAAALSHCRRVLVMGCNGAGKTTFARRLGAALGIDVVHLDSLLFRQGWEFTPRDEFVRLQESVVSREHWIIDGNCLSTFDVRAGWAEAVIVFDLPAAVCVLRTLRRTLQYLGRSRPDLPDDCVERLDAGYMRFVWRVFTFHRHFMPRVERCVATTAPGTLVVRIRSSRVAHDVLRALENRPRTPD